MSPSNGKRADWAAEGVRAYAIAKSTTRRADYDPIEYLITDLLCDLMHLAKREGVDFNDRLRIAEGHFEEEVDEERAITNLDQETAGVS